MPKSMYKDKARKMVDKKRKRITKGRNLKAKPKKASGMALTDREEFDYALKHSRKMEKKYKEDPSEENYRLSIGASRHKVDSARKKYKLPPVNWKKDKK